MRSVFVALICAVALAAPSLSLAQTAPAPPAPGLIMVRVFASDMARSERFYQETFGMTVRVLNAREHALLFEGGQPPGIMLLPKTPDSPAITSSFMVRVADIDAVMTHAVASGGAVTQPARTAGPVRQGFVTDPDGTLIEVTQYVTRP